MKIALSWLEEYFIDKPNWDFVFDKLTGAGIEIEGIEPVAPYFSGIIVAEVVECERHPNADKLNLCKVNVGNNELLSIVCGASNVEVGVKVPCAIIGAVLPDGLVIAERKMRGVTSFGMLCSGDEIAMPNGVDGLLLLPQDAPVGLSIRDYLSLDDKIIELKITPNRGDCLSIRGLLREISSLTDYTYKYSDDYILKTTISDKIKVNVDVAEACPNYVGVIIKNINNKVKLPDFIIKRILRSGYRSVSPLVDIVSYVMLELGQPLHTFDYEKIGDSVRVRFANENETLKVLDGTVVTLTTDTLVICGEDNHVVAIAGVMGGLDSGVCVDTTSVVLESAFFKPDVIAGKTKKYVVSSDAAYRFERGVDTKIQEKALRYATQLIIQYLGGEAGQTVSVSHINEEQKPSIKVKFSEFEALIGIKLSDEEITAILTKLEFNIVKQDKVMLDVTPPSFRFDIAIKEDVIEEVARVYGYDNIPAVLPVVNYTMDAVNPLQTRINKIKSSLVSRGYNEIISYAFIEDTYAKIFQSPEGVVVSLKNPIAGLSVMRSTLFAGLVRTMQNNINRGAESIKLFELARVFYSEDENAQPLKIAGLLYGNRDQINWSNQRCEVDFYDIKSEVEILLNNTSEIKFVACADYQFLHSGRCAKIYACGKEIGIMGQLHPLVGQTLGLDSLPYMFELDINALTEHDIVFSFQPISKYQKVTRDLAFITDSSLSVGLMINYIKSCNIDDLRDVVVFDIYKGSHLGEGKKSIAIKLIFQADKTLTDEEIEVKVNQVIKNSVEQFNIKLRGDI